MKLSPDVIEALQKSAEAHWTAIHLYTALEAHLMRWGYPKLAERFGAEASDERGHLDALLARLEFSDTTCDSSGAPAAFERHDAVAILKDALAMETEARDLERAAVATARSAMDEGSAAIFERNLKGTEDSVAELEASLKVVSQIGIENFLAGMTA